MNDLPLHFFYLGSWIWIYILSIFFLFFSTSSQCTPYELVCLWLGMLIRFFVEWDIVSSSVVKSSSPNTKRLRFYSTNTSWNLFSSKSLRSKVGQLGSNILESESDGLSCRALSNLD